MPPPTPFCIMGFIWLFLGGDDWVCEEGKHSSWHGREDEKSHLELVTWNMLLLHLYTTAAFKRNRILTDRKF